LNDEYRDAAFGTGEAEEEEVDADSDVSPNHGAKEAG
jgi:hypothetical protein